MTVSTALEPVAVWDTSTADWWRDREAKEAWLQAHDLLGKYVYRIEFYLPNAPCARIFCYAVNEEGKRHWNHHHVPGPHDHSGCGPCREEPRMILLPDLPPPELRR